MPSDNVTAHTILENADTWITLDSPWIGVPFKRNKSK